MAIVTASGALFTCGDGFGGKLGHGSFASEGSPRQVRFAALRHAAGCCSSIVWGLAARAEPRMRPDPEHADEVGCSPWSGS